MLLLFSTMAKTFREEGKGNIRFWRNIGLYEDEVGFEGLVRRGLGLVALMWWECSYKDTAGLEKNGCMVYLWMLTRLAHDIILGHLMGGNQVKH